MRNSMSENIGMPINQGLVKVTLDQFNVWNHWGYSVVCHGVQLRYCYRAMTEIDCSCTRKADIDRDISSLRKYQHTKNMWSKRDVTETAGVFPRAHMIRWTCVSADLKHETTSLNHSGQTMLTMHGLRKGFKRRLLNAYTTNVFWFVSYMYNM